MSSAAAVEFRIPGLATAPRLAVFLKADPPFDRPRKVEDYARRAGEGEGPRSQGAGTHTESIEAVRTDRINTRL
jgi:hypothetical protein